MRPIKFRAWDKQLLNMADVATIGINFGMGYSCYEGEPVVENITREDIKGLPLHVGGNDTRFIIMQFTGLKDKNGKEIYEGDILSLTDYLNDKGHTAIFWIGYDEESGGFSFNEVGYGQAVPFVVAGRSEIIGNIYENKELINNK